MHRHLRAGSVRTVHALVAALLLLLGTAPRVIAQTAPGAVEGVARSADGGSPLPFALVRLVRAADPAAPVASVVTDAAGRFRFAAVAAGDYRLQLERIGHGRALSPTLRVQPGETLVHVLRGAVEPVQLAGITVRPEGPCLDAARLAEDPQMNALWNEARKGIETRRAFQQQFRFTRVWRQDVVTRLRLVRDTREVRMDTLVSEPDSAAARTRRRAERLRTEGYGTRGGLVLTLPDEADLLDDAFLQGHCLETPVEEEAGSLAIRFRPVRDRRDAADIRGTLWLDARTFGVRRLDVQWVEGTFPIAWGHVDYGDVEVDRVRLRLPTGGRVEGRPSGVVAAVVTGASAEMTFTYSGFEQVRRE